MVRDQANGEKSVSRKYGMKDMEETKKNYVGKAEMLVSVVLLYNLNMLIKDILAIFVVQ